MSLPMDGVKVTIRTADADYDVNRLKVLFEQLHAHQVTTSPTLAGLPSRDPEAAWQRRRRRYLSWLGLDRVMVLEAVDRDCLIGFAIISAPVGYDGWQSEERIGELHELVVASTRRGNGVGSRLIETMMAKLADVGVRQVRVSLIASNESARRFYARHGFAVVSQVMLRAD